MARTKKEKPTPTAPPTEKKSRRKSKTAQFETLQSKKTAIRDEFSKSKKTRDAYKGYLKRGREILADIVKQRRLDEKTVPGWKCEAGIDTDILEKAFEGPPNKHSATALELYLTQKCVVEGLKKSTADGIHGAFADYWDQLDGGKYASEYKFDEETGKVTGCPARAPQIEAFMKCIKTKTQVKGEAATRRHAEATTIEDMQKMMDWSHGQCSPEELDRGKPADREALLRLEKHGLMRAFLSSGYCLWTRNFELCQLQERDLTSDAHGPSPYNLPFVGVFLDNRKGWQKRQGYDGPLNSNHYDIYAQPDTPEICMFTKLMAWRKFYRERLGRAFEPDDYVFPYISTNGTIHPKKPMSHDLVQEYINEFASGAGIDKIFTTHCLRRGGSQYRFMFAPIGKRWSLSIIRWWGGWAEGEQVDTLMRYLLDSLQSYESGHGDALNPHRLEMDKSFMGDHNVSKPASVAEVRSLGTQLLNKLNRLTAAPTHCPHHLPHCITLSGTAASVSSIMSLSIQTPTSASAIPGGTSLSRSLLHLPAPISHQSSPSTTGPLARDSTPRRNSVPLPLPGISIPNVGKGPTAWRQAITQWELGDPSAGVLPLKDWPPSYYTGSMRLTTGALYSNRKLLASEYERLGHDDTKFMQAYPEHSNLTKLMKAIREKTGRTRPSTRRG